MITFNSREEEIFLKDIMGNGENAGNRDFPTFSIFSKRNCTIFTTMNLFSANTFNLDKAKILTSGTGLMLYQHNLTSNCTFPWSKQ